MESHDPHVPQNFFDDTYLLPSFYTPENKELFADIHNSIRRNLLSSTFIYFKHTEFKRLKEDDDFFEFRKFKNQKKHSSIAIMVNLCNLEETIDCLIPRLGFLIEMEQMILNT
ncbi:unnamed protein product [Moneuplotes crassus]|uniref:Uncharacterized protein n=1 Tax=Euplotes crassus TaxID=5936 RepID=A0AAD1XWB0_EUPCR|nr:unnamed protein product [Moneuplotes crassus]